MPADPDVSSTEEGQGSGSSSVTIAIDIDMSPSPSTSTSTSTSLSSAAGISSGRFSPVYKKHNHTTFHNITSHNTSSKYTILHIKISDKGAIHLKSGIWHMTVPHNVLLCISAHRKKCIALQASYYKTLLVNPSHDTIFNIAGHHVSLEVNKTYGITSCQTSPSKKYAKPQGLVLELQYLR